MLVDTVVMRLCETSTIYLDVCWAEEFSVNVNKVFQRDIDKEEHPESKFDQDKS